jgi:fumarate reductase subunit C
MVEPATGTRYHSPGYRPHLPANWWTKNGHYFMYMVRELTAVFVALWVVLFLVQLPSMAAFPKDPGAYYRWLQFVRSPEWVIFSFITLFFVGYHAATWFILMGTVMTMRLGKTRIPPALIIGTMFVAWFGISIILLVIIGNPFLGG